MKNVGISTVFTGYNYGSSLQAYATKHILNSLGYTGELFKLSGSLVKGRDIRLKKLYFLAINAFLNYKYAKKSISAYSQSISANYSDETKKLFENFINNYLNPTVVSWKELKRKAFSDEYVAFISGSDQIWNADTLFVDPFYYLKYAPEYKRIAYAPSFGRTEIPEYNKKRITNYISKIPFLSVREESGALIIKKLLNRTADVLVDPTLALNSLEWKEAFNLKEREGQRYLLAYFLNEPSKDTKTNIRKLANNNGLRIIGIPYIFENDNFIDELYTAGPIEFLNLINNASIVCTDSFHGTAFSLNFGKPFFVFERNYGKASAQSTRIISLLEKTETLHRYCINGEIINTEIDFNKVFTVLNEERGKSINYLLNSLKEVAINAK